MTNRLLSNVQKAAIFAAFLFTSQVFADRIFVERLAYLVRLKQAGILLAAGPFEGLVEGLYLVNVPDELAARRVLEEDPLYRAGFIAREYTLHRWLVAI